MGVWQASASKLLRPVPLVVPLGLLWAAALGAGAFGVYQIAAVGHKTTATGSYIPWGLGVALYIFFVESAAGMHLASSLGTVFGWGPFVRIIKLNLFLSFIFAIGGLSLIWLDLGRPERLWEFYLRPNFSSPMNFMAWVYAAFMLLQACQLAWEFRADRRRAQGLPLSPAEEGRHLAVRRTLGYIGIPVAVALSSGVGFLVGNPASQLYFQVGLYPLHFIATALASGAAILALVSALFLAHRDAEMRRLAVIAGQLTLVGVIGEGLFIFFDLFVSVYGGVPRLVDSVMAVLTGPYAWAFWLFQVGIGMAIPFLVLINPRLSVRPGWIGAAGFMVAFGFVVVRLNAVLPAFVVPQLNGLPKAFVNPRLSIEYFPSVAEWLAAIFIGAVRAIREGPGSAAERLAGVCRFAVDVLKTAPAAVRVLLLEVARTPNVVRAGSTRQTFEEAVRLVAEMVREGQRAGELRADADPVVAAAGLLGALEMSLTAMVTGVVPSATEAEVERAKEQVVDFVLGGVGHARPGS